MDPQIATVLMERLQQHNNPALQPAGPENEQKALVDKRPAPKPKPNKTGEGEDVGDERPTKKAKVQKEKVKARNQFVVNFLHIFSIDQGHQFVAPSDQIF